MEPGELLERLQTARSLRHFVEAELLGRVPWIFEGDGNAFNAWRDLVTKEVGITGKAIFLVGSAAVGFSLSPLKAGRPFRPVGSASLPSDIDVAVVDSGLFEQAWNTLVRFDRGRSLPTVSPGFSVVETRQKMRVDVYWGTVSHSHMVAGTDEAHRLRLLFAATTRRAPFTGYQPRARIYRREEDLISYHEDSLRKLMVTLGGGDRN